MPERSILEELQASFQKKEKSDWIHIASTEVNAQDPLKKLQWIDKDQLTFLPYYDKSDLPLDYRDNFQLQPDSRIFLGQRGWYNLSPVAVTEERYANEASHKHVMHGADGIILDIRKKDVKLSTLLDGIEWPFCNMSFVSSEETSLPDEIINHCNNKSYSSEKIEGSIFWRNPPSFMESFRQFRDFKKFHCAGIFIEHSTPSVEIANALFHGVNSVNNFIDNDVATEIALQSISFSLTSDKEFFISIAKFKALRMLWYQVSQAYGCTQFKPDDLHLHARSEVLVDQNYYPHGNMLKSTASSIAAICGGCNSLTVYGEDEDNTMMQRMARNTPVILREESYLSKVADPLAGSYALEVMINTLAKESWQKFQSLSADL